MQQNTLSTHHSLWLNNSKTYIMTITGTIQLLQKQILRLINFMSPRESTEELFTSHQIPDMYKVYIYELFKFCLKVEAEEITANPLNKLFVGKDNDTRGSRLGF